MDLESLGYPNLEVPSSNLRVSLTPKILDVSRVQALGWVQVSLGIGDQSSNSQLSENKKRSNLHGGKYYYDLIRLTYIPTPTASTR